MGENRFAVLIERRGSQRERPLLAQTMPMPPPMSLKNKIAVGSPMHGKECTAQNVVAHSGAEMLAIEFRCSRNSGRIARRIIPAILIVRMTPGEMP